MSSTYAEWLLRKRKKFGDQSGWDANYEAPRMTTPAFDPTKQDQNNQVMLDQADAELLRKQAIEAQAAAQQKPKGVGSAQANVTLTQAYTPAVADLQGLEKSPQQKADEKNKAKVAKGEIPDASVYDGSQELNDAEASPSFTADQIAEANANKGIIKPYSPQGGLDSPYDTPQDEVEKAKDKISDEPDLADQGTQSANKDVSTGDDLADQGTQFYDPKLANSLALEDNTIQQDNAPFAYQDENLAGQSPSVANNPDATDQPPFDWAAAGAQDSPAPLTPESFRAGPEEATPAEKKAFNRMGATRGNITKADVEAVLGKQPSRLSMLAYGLTGGLAGENRLKYNTDAAEVRKGREKSLNTEDIYDPRLRNALTKEEIKGQYNVAGRQAEATGRVDSAKVTTAGRDRATVARSADLKARMAVDERIASNKNESFDNRTAAMERMRRYDNELRTMTTMRGQDTNYDIASERNATSRANVTDTNANRSGIAQAAQAGLMARTVQQGQDALARVVEQIKIRQATLNTYQQKDNDMRLLTGGQPEISPNGQPTGRVLGGAGITEVSALIQGAAAGEPTAKEKLPILWSLFSKNGDVELGPQQSQGPGGTKVIIPAQEQLDALPEGPDKEYYKKRIFSNPAFRTNAPAFRTQ